MMATAGGVAGRNPGIPRLSVGAWLAFLWSYIIRLLIPLLCQRGRALLSWGRRRAGRRPSLHRSDGWRWRIASSIGMTMVAGSSLCRSGSIVVVGLPHPSRRLQIHQRASSGTCGSPLLSLSLCRRCCHRLDASGAREGHHHHVGSDDLLLGGLVRPSAAPPHQHHRHPRTR